MAYKRTDKSEEALAGAIQQATADGNPQVEPVHLLLALLQQTDGMIRPLFEKVGADLDQVRTEAAALQRKLPQTHGDTASRPEGSRQLLSVLNTAEELAGEMGDDYLSTEHLLVGLATGNGPLAKALQQAGATPEALTDAINQAAGRHSGHHPEPRDHVPGA